jgi:hypothetical protein
MLIDTHCHLCKDDYENVDEIIKNMDGLMIASGCSDKTNKEVLELIENNTWVCDPDPVTDCYFINKGQDIEIIEIDINEIKKPTLLLSSYNAG